MTYREAIKYLESLINYEKLSDYPYKQSLKLTRLKGFLAQLGNPQELLRCIQVAGSKGKGSTCAFITYILREAGYKVGLYTSPHLADFRERIRILQSQRVKESESQRQNDFEGMISKRDLALYVKKIRPAIIRYNQKSKYGPLSFFEVYTSLAFLYFLEKRVDFAVLETGLGGRLDATNVVHALACAITPISYEHTQKLGNTLGEIAAEKAGIIKGQGARGKGQLIVISAPQEKEAMRVIRRKCKNTGARLIEAGKKRPYPGLKMKLIGRHQIINANVAIEVIKALASYGIYIGDKVIKAGLGNTVWPGRCEVVARNPLIILDGAQNVASAVALKKAIKENFKYRKLILVLGISNDKDVAGICRQLSGLAQMIVLTRADNPRAVLPHILAGFFQDKENYLTQNVSGAKKLSLRLAGRRDLILVTGSLFVVGEFRNA